MPPIWRSRPSESNYRPLNFHQRGSYARKHTIVGASTTSIPRVFERVFDTSRRGWGSERGSDGVSRTVTRHPA